MTPLTHVSERAFAERERRDAEELIHRLGMDDAEKLALGVGPQVLRSAGHVNPTRRDQAGQLVLIGCKLVLSIRKTQAILAEPVREKFLDAANRLAEPAPRERRAG